MWVYVDRLGRVLLDGTVAVSVLLGVISLWMLICRQPALRTRIARGAAMASLALLPLCAVSARPRIDMLGALRESGLVSHVLQTVGRSRTEPPGDSIAAWEPLARLGPVLIGPARLLTLAYLVGLGAGLAWLGFGFWGMRWLLNQSAAPSPATIALYERLSHEEGGSRPLLRVGRRLRGPVLIGLFRPTIVIPPHLDQPESEEALRLSLLHELAHARGADPWFCLAAEVANALWFHVPPLWWIRRQLTLDHEFLADRRAAVDFGPTPHYAASLIALATPAADPTPTTTHPTSNAALPAPVISALFQRVLMLVQCPFPVEDDAPLWSRRLLPIAIAALTIASATLTIRWPEAAPTALQVTSGHTFRLARLAVAPKPAGPLGRVPLLELPLRLPARFALSVDVWSDPAALPLTRVAGHPLALALSRPESEPRAAPGWHKVQIRRDNRDVTLQVDGRDVPLDPRRGTTTVWLSVEAPPDRPARFQNLVLSW